MKHLILLTLTVFTIFNSYGQEEIDIDKATKAFKNIQKWVANDNIDALSRNIAYPFERFDRLPALQNVNEFKAYYSTLFDKEMKTIFENVDFDNDNIITHYTGSVGFESGNIWINSSDKLQSIHYQSVTEIKKNEFLLNDLRANIHSSVSDWKSNEAYIQSENMIVRVDYLGGSIYRYASWKKTKTILNKPDLVLVSNDESVANYDESGNIHFVFKNGMRTYNVDYIAVDEEKSIYNWSVSIFENEDDVKVYECEEVE